MHIYQTDFSTSQLKSNQEPDAKIHNMTKILKNSQRAVLSWILVSGSWLLLSWKYGLEGTSDFNQLFPYYQTNSRQKPFSYHQYSEWSVRKYRKIRKKIYGLNFWKQDFSNFLLQNLKIDFISHKCIQFAFVYCKDYNF